MLADFHEAQAQLHVEWRSSADGQWSAHEGNLALIAMGVVSETSGFGLDRLPGPGCEQRDFADHSSSGKH
jgi:hypothetical protein